MSINPEFIAKEAERILEHQFHNIKVKGHSIDYGNSLAFCVEVRDKNTMRIRHSVKMDLRVVDSPAVYETRVEPAAEYDIREAWMDWAEDIHIESPSLKEIQSNIPTVRVGDPIKKEVCIKKEKCHYLESISPIEVAGILRDWLIEKTIKPSFALQGKETPGQYYY